MQGTCRDYTIDLCEKEGDNKPFETNKEGNAKKCQQYCKIYQASQNCTFFIYDYESETCSLFNYPMKDFMDSCKIYAGTPKPGLDSCAAEEGAECFVS